MTDPAVQENMPGLIRKLVLIAAVEGLIIQPHPSLRGVSERSDSQALRLDYKTRKITPWNIVTVDAYKKVPHLESHGIIGRFQYSIVLAHCWPHQLSSSAH